MEELRNLKEGRTGSDSEGWKDKGRAGIDSEGWQDKERTGSDSEGWQDKLDQLSVLSS